MINTNVNESSQKEILYGFCCENGHIHYIRKDEIVKKCDCGSKIFTYKGRKDLPKVVVKE